jgi:hypothetical protein
MAERLRVQRERDGLPDSDDSHRAKSAPLRATNADLTLSKAAAEEAARLRPAYMSHKNDARLADGNNKLRSPRTALGGAEERRKRGLVQ